MSTECINNNEVCAIGEMSKVDAFKGDALRILFSARFSIVSLFFISFYRRDRVFLFLFSHNLVYYFLYFGFTQIHNVQSAFFFSISLSLSLPLSQAESTCREARYFSVFSFHFFLFLWFRRFILQHLLHHLLLDSLRPKQVPK